MNKLSIVGVAALFVAATLGAPAPYGQESPLLSQICDNDKFPSKELKSLSKLDELVQQVDSAPCPQLIKSAMVDLHSLIMDHQRATCSQESANAIADYQAKYLAARDERTGALIEYPRAMKPFFVAYGLQVASFCRRQMVDLLMADSQQLVGANYLKELAEFTDDKGYVAAFMDDSTNRNDLLVPDNFINMMDSFGRAGQEKERLFLEVPATKKIKHLQSVCERRFEPIYKKLIMPLVTLASAGFNYKTQATSKREPDVSKQVSKWYWTVFFCEAIKATEVFQTPRDLPKPSSSSKQQVRVLEKDEADRLRASLVAGQDEGVDVERIDYEPHLETLHLDNVVYDDDDPRLYKAVMAFRRRARKLNDPGLARRLIRLGLANFRHNSLWLIKQLTGLKGSPATGWMTSVDIAKMLGE